MSDWIPPAVSDTHPAPADFKPVRKRGNPRPPSPWRKFLTGLQPGQSFRVGWYLLQTVKVNAERDGVKIAWAEDEPYRDERGFPCARVWRVA